MNNLLDATRIKYIPRASTYTILHHDVMIKVSSSDGGLTWMKGCIYRDETSHKIYSRPYDWFSVENWEIIL